MINSVKFNSDHPNKILSRLFKLYTLQSQSIITYINGARGEYPPFFFPPTKMMLEVEILFNTFPEIHHFLHMSQAGNDCCWVSSIYLKGTAAYEKETYMTVLRKALQTCSGKATLLCSSVLDRDTSTFHIHILLWIGTHSLSSATHSELHSAHALPPGKRGRSIYVYTLKKPTKWSVEVIGFVHFPQNQLMHVKLAQEE